MKISEWVAIARRDVRSYNHVVCGFCGAETLAHGPASFCSNCESLVGLEVRPTEGHLIGELRRAVLGNDFEGAAAVYVQLAKHRQSPQLLYAEGLLRIQHSNYVVSLIGYANERMAGQNPALREMGALLFSDGKRLIAKSRSLSEAESKGAPSAHAFYRIFLCDLKMGELAGASWCLDRIIELDREGTIAQYAKIVMNVQGGLYNEAEMELDALIKAKTPPANAFYYAAFVAFKMGDRRGAERILGASRALVEEPKRAHILEAMKGVASFE